MILYVGFNRKEMELYEAYKVGDLQKVKFLVENDRYELISTFDLSYGVDLADDKNDFPMIKYLIEKGAECNLYVACKIGHLDRVKFLVKNGEPVNAYNNYAVGLASSQGHIPVIKYLASVGADITDDFNLPFRSACENGHLETVKYLVSIGADPTYGSNHTVWEASINGHIDVIKYLISLGIDITGNNSALDVACRNGHFEIAQLLLENGADINVLSKKHKNYFRRLRYFRRWRKVIFRRFFRKTVIPLYYSPGFPGGIRVRSELLALITPKERELADMTKLN